MHQSGRPSPKADGPPTTGGSSTGCFVLQSSRAVAYKRQGEVEMRALPFLRLLAKAAISSAFIVGFSVQPALAYTQLLNDFPNVPPFCGSSSGLPCLYYAEPPQTVITIPAFLHPSLSDGTAISDAGIYNFVPAIQRAFNDYNVVPWWNPSFASCTTAGCGWVNYQVGLLPCNVTGATNRPFGPVGQQPNGEWYALFPTTPGSRTVTFNSDVLWNETLTFAASTDGCFQTSARSDGRNTSTHETGHVSSLGHTGNNPAVMRADPTNPPATYFALQPDDIAGLGAIYNGSSPSS